MNDPRHQLALDLFQQAYAFQMQGDLESAVRFYTRSIEAFPTAEAYTYLGWTYSFQGKYEAAIDECKNAILIDPGFGNPYNDIGAYLINQGKFDDAIPWLEKAIASRRYDAYHYPWYNLGRAFAAKEMYKRARECFQKSAEISPGFDSARQALAKLRTAIQ